jgi:hypothetical protein
MPRKVLLKKPHVAKWRQDPKQLEKFQFIHHFLPHPYHKKRAGLLSHFSLGVYCLVILSFLTGYKLFIKTYPGVLGYASNIRVGDLLTYTNSRRTAEGLKALRLNDALTRAAQKKAEDMFKNGYWAHVSPSGKEPWDFILTEKYDYSYAGENLAKNFNSSKDVVTAWYNSPSHKENLMSKNYDEIGFAVVNGVLDGYETTLVVQMFGRPRNLAGIASPEQETKTLASITSEAVKTEPVPASNSEVGTLEPLPAQQKFPLVQLQQVLPALDVSLATKSIALLFFIYLAVLFALDIWYSRRHAISKFTGHSWAHLAFLLVSLAGVLFALLPGKIL